MKHEHTHQHNHEHQATGNIKVAFFLNLIFTVIEIVGGILTNSMAILSDALHDLGDSISLGIAWYFEGYAQKRPDRKYSFGYSRFSLVGALINSLVLVVGSALILINAIPRVIRPESVQPRGMVILAIAGIVINGVAVLRLRQGSSLNEKVVSWHLLEDVLGWVVVLIGGIVMMFIEIPIIDPILSIVITVYILVNILKRLKEIFHVLLQGVPEDIDIAHIEKEIQAAKGVVAVYHTHIWSLEGQKNMLSTHVIVEETIKKEAIVDIKNEIRQILIQLHIEHVTLEIEFESEDHKTLYDD